MVYNFVYFDKPLLSERSNVVTLYFDTPIVVFSVPRDLIIYVVLYIEEDAPPPQKSVLGVVLFQTNILFVNQYNSIMKKVSRLDMKCFLRLSSKSTVLQLQNKGEFHKCGCFSFHCFVILLSFVVT